MTTFIVRDFKSYDLLYSFSCFLNLPNDTKSLLSLSVDYETELNKIEEDSPRRLELLRILFEINLKLNYHEEAITWGEKFIELNPKDLIMPIKMVVEYFHIKNYKKFLRLANKLGKENKYDILAL